MSPGAQLVRVAAAAPQPDAPDEQVEEAAQPPQPVARSTSPSRRRSGGSARRPLRRARPRARDRESTSRRPERCTPPHDRWPRCRRERVRPAGRGELAVLVDERPRDRLADAPRPDRRTLERGRVVDHRLVADAVDQLAADPGVDRRDQAEPEAREPRREHRDREIQPPQAALPRVLAHDVAVGDAVGAADLEHAPSPRRSTSSAASEVGDHVLDRRSAGRACRTQRGVDHHRQPLDERADHLEREAAGADDDRGAELDRRDARPRAGSGRPPGGSPGGATGREPAAEAAEVDDPPHAGLAGRARRSRSAPRRSCSSKEPAEPIEWTR